MKRPNKTILDQCENLSSNSRFLRTDVSNLLKQASPIVVFPEDYSIGSLVKAAVKSAEGESIVGLQVRALNKIEKDTNKHAADLGRMAATARGYKEISEYLAGDRSHIDSEYITPEQKRMVKSAKHAHQSGLISKARLDDMVDLSMLVHAKWMPRIKMAGAQIRKNTAAAKASCFHTISDYYKKAAADLKRGGIPVDRIGYDAKSIEKKCEIAERNQKRYSAAFKSTFFDKRGYQSMMNVKPLRGVNYE